MREEPRQTLTPRRVTLGSADFLDFLTWPFRPEPFFEGQVPRLLKSDVMQRLLSGSCYCWAFYNAQDQVVGFGTLDICEEYIEFTSSKHTYIPLVAVHPIHQGRGYGRKIVEYLIGEAAVAKANQPDLSELLFLDVYEANHVATSLYLKCGFAILETGTPLLDQHEQNAPYLVMARYVVPGPQ